MAEFASKGVAGTGLGLGIAGTALGLLSGSANNLLNTALHNTSPGYYEGECVCKGDLKELMAKDAEIARLNSERYADKNGLELYKYIAAELKDINNTIENNKDNTNAQFAQQAVYNATVNSSIATVANQVTNLQNLVGSITKTAVPQSAICDFGCGCGCGCSLTTI
jgi:hypothetical protein